MLSIGLMLAMWYIYGGCWFTDLEKKFIRKYDETKVYEGTFIVHYLYKFLKIRAKENYAFVTYML